MIVPIVWVGCAAAPKQVVVAIPSSPTARMAPNAVTGLEDATDTIRIYERDTVDPESAMPTMGGYVRVHAPLDVAFAVATRFGEIKDLNPEYIEQSTVVDRQPALGVADVYLKVPTVIHEYVWAVVRFKPVRTNVGYAYRGDEIEGNLDDLRIYWRLVPSGGETIAQFEFLADPHLPIPRPWILPEVREGVRIILDRFRKKAERAAHHVDVYNAD
ncbi:MAG TPA: SRPBCC family protein [Polyangiaceae bacterium]|nr:SRPBCC family protein [Polyangiaceae bacterium]